MRHASVAMENLPYSILYGMPLALVLSVKYLTNAPRLIVHPAKKEKLELILFREIELRRLSGNFSYFGNLSLQHFKDSLSLHFEGPDG